MSTPISVKTNEEINSYIAENFYKSNTMLQDEIDDLYNTTLSLDAIRNRKRRIRQNPKIRQVEDSHKTESLSKDAEIHKLKKELIKVNTKVKNLIQQNVELSALKDYADEFEQSVTSSNKVSIVPSYEDDESESVAVVVLSDWHYEENIKSESVNGLNEFNTAIADERINNCFTSIAKLINQFKNGTEINTTVLALLGDFITNSIHEELMEVNELQPMEAVVKIYNHLVAGIDFLMEEFPDMEFKAVCKVGNHSRTTKRVHVSTESGNSLEYLLYYFLAANYKENERITFVLEKNYLTYVNVFGYTVRFHHGHNVRYAGGVGGITIPVNKAIAQWDKSRTADIDVFGHFHQTTIDRNFICNGSLIGYSPYALSIKAEFEKPSQTLFLIEKDHGRTIVAPIFLED